MATTSKRPRRSQGDEDVPKPKTRALADRSTNAAPPLNQFEAVLAAAGFTLTSQIHTLSTDTATFSRHCYATFNRRPEAVTEFVQGFSAHVSDMGCLRKALQPWKRVGGEGRTTIYAQQDTLTKLLLGSEHLQTDVLNTLLELMAEHAEEMGTGATSDSVPRLLLSQIRWMDRVVDCVGLANNLMEVMQALGPEMQREVIECLPEIIDDHGHATVLDSLMEILENDASFMPSVLDSMSNLNLEEGRMELVHEKVDTPLPVRYTLCISGISYRKGVCIRCCPGCALPS
jgi:Fanconi anemia group D2 protein